MRRTVAPERCMPYPELAEAEFVRKPYEVRDSREVRGPAPDGMVDLVNRRIFVPLLPRGRATARHELGHVCWSPPKLPDLDYPPLVLLTVEDARINLGLRRAGLPVDLDRSGRTKVASLAAQDVEQGRYADYVIRAIASIGTDVEREARDAGADAPEIIVDTAARLCRRVKRRLSDNARRRASAEADFALAVRLGREIARELAALGLDVPADAPALLELAGPSTEGPGRPGRGSGKDGDGVSGELSIVTAPLTVPLAAARVGARSWAPAAEGSVVRWVHRYPIDGRIFRRVVRGRSGTVLVDTSGSMSFSTKDLDRIVSATSAATQVAIYSGTGKKGELRIVAKNGRRAASAHLESFARGNVVDEPCLEWLAHQRGPRVWISDGGVTGINDTPSAALRRRCGRLVARSGIRRAKDVEEALAALAGRRAASA